MYGVKKRKDLIYFHFQEARTTDCDGNLIPPDGRKRIVKALTISKARLEKPAPGYTWHVVDMLRWTKDGLHSICFESRG